MKETFKGIIIEESLKDSRVLNNFKTTSFKITTEENPADRWHLFTVRGSKEAIANLASFINGSKWYTHFWNDEEVLVIFENKVFEYKRSEFNQKKPEVVEYGKKLGIPSEQLDFPLED